MLSLAAYPVTTLYTGGRMPERTREIAELLVAGLGGAGLTGFWGWIAGCSIESRSHPWCLAWT